MDIGVSLDGSRGGRALLVMAAAAAGVIAASLLLVTWGGVRSQWALVERHMLLAGGIVLRSAEARMLRAMRHDPACMMPRPDAGPTPFDSLLADAAGGGDVRFLALLAPGGEVLAAAVGDAAMAQAMLPPPPEALDGVRSGGEWHRLEQNAQGAVLLLARRARPEAGALCPQPGGMPPAGDPHAGPEGRGRGRGPGRAHDHPSGPPGPLPWLYVGLGVDDYLAQYAELRRAAMLQTGATLVAAALGLGLVSLLLRRRDQGRALTALRRFQARLVDAMPDGLLTLDASGTILAANPAAATMLGRNGRELPGTALEGLGLEPVAGLELAPGWAEYAMDGRRLEVLESPVDAAGGSGDDGVARLVLLRDRTAMKALERRLAEAEKLAALGSMAARVAHEIRNPLSALRGFAQFFQGRLAGRQPDAEYAATMVREADRLNRVIADMLFLARPRPMEPQRLDAAAALAEAGRLLDAEAQARGATLRLAAKAAAVRADPDALKQMALNLGLNALASTPPDGGEVEIGIVPVDGGAELRVTDNGPGFSAEALERGAEPFFTTRPGGTGLGLAIVDRLAREHGGRLTLANRPNADSGSGQGGGAAATVFLPDAEPAGGGVEGSGPAG